MTVHCIKFNIDIAQRCHYFNNYYYYQVYCVSIVVALLFIYSSGLLSPLLLSVVALLVYGLTVVFNIKYNIHYYYHELYFHNLDVIFTTLPGKMHWELIHPIRFRAYDTKYYHGMKIANQIIKINKLQIINIQINLWILYLNLH